MTNVIFYHKDDIPWQEVRAQQHGDRRAGVHLKFLERNATRTLSYARYDPGMIVERHGHVNDHVLYITKGDVMVGDTHCAAGTTVVLERGAKFGPLVAGDQGAEMFEVYWGDPGPVPEDPEAFKELLRSKGIEPLPHPPFSRP